MGCWERSGARQAGCGPRQRVILVPGGNRRSSGVAAGMPMHCATLCARAPAPAQAGALGHLAADDAVLIVDETGFLKQGKASCGVARQYPGSAAKITNCQIGVFAAYVSRHGHAFIDRALYLPKAWTDDRTRMATAHVPRGTGFRTKPQLAAAMIERAIAADVPFGWVAGDSIYGVGEIEMMLRHAGKGYVLGVSASHPFTSWIGKPEVAGTAEEIAGNLEE